jgi:homoserine dehydrogenase
MKMEKVLTIGLLGLGTVGSGVVEILQRSAEELYLKHGLRTKIKRILVKEKNKQREIEVDPSLIS